MKRFESKIVYTHNSSLVNYQSEEKQNVLYRTMHKNVQILDGTKALPESIDYYNHNKHCLDI